jgi:Rieske Fe-S protein
MADHPSHHPVSVDPPEPPGRGTLASTITMVAGLLGGYGLFAWIGGRFMLPARTGQMTQLFVAGINDIAVGGTLLFRAPDGRTVNITRRESTGRAGDFVALSSTCPHLGCQVGWEAQNNRYYCPCHGGTFDPSGKGTGGPPGDAGQSLPRYSLAVQKGLLYIDVPTEQLTVPQQAGVVHLATPQGPGHDPCLACLKKGRGPVGPEPPT